MTETPAPEFVLHTDGGARGNPGPAGIGFVLEQGGATVAAGGAFIGEATNNVAEYEALIWGLKNARALKARRLRMIADSELMVKQVTGVYRVKNVALKERASCVLALLQDFESWTLEHAYRADNSAADTLVNEALDARAEVGQPAVSYEAAPASLFPAEEGKSALAASQKTANEQEASEMHETPGTYYLTVKDHFDAAHNLYGYPGPCRELHGHTWDVEVTVSGRTLDDIGILCDFKQIKDDLAGVLAAYDHHYVNEVAPFDTLSPTAENLARIIYDRLSEGLDPRVKIDEVAVWESPVARVAFRADDAR